LLFASFSRDIFQWNLSIFCFISCNAILHRKPSMFRHHQSQIIKSPVLILSCVMVWLRIWSPAMTVYFLPPPSHGGVRWEPPPPPFLLCGRSFDGQFWLQILGSNKKFFSPHLLPYWSVAIVVLTSSSSSTFHHFNILRETVFWVLLLDRHSAQLSWSTGCLKLLSSFPCSVFGHRSPGVASWPSQEPSARGGLEPDGPHRNLA
jgi:hypothetical protein